MSDSLASKTTAQGAVAFIEKHTRRPWQRVVFGLIFLFPILGNILSRLSKHGWWLNDFDALICGADHVRRGLSPYGLDPVCAATRPAVYVYAPQVAEVLAPLTHWLSLSTLRLIWWLPWLASLGLLLWYALFMVLKDAPWRLRLMTLASMAGSAYACGNIGIVLHALILLAALQLPRQRWPFILAVIFAALIKPVMLTYLIVLMFEKRAWPSRLIVTIAASLAGLAAVAAEMLTAGPLSADWHNALGAIVMSQQPGIGFFAWTSWLHLPPYAPYTLALLAVFMAVTAVAGLVLAEQVGDDLRARLVIGIGIAQLLNPRLMDYDMLALAPFMALVVMMTQSLDRKLFVFTSWAFTGVLGFAVLCNLFQFAHSQRSPIVVLAYTVIVLSVAASIMRNEKRPESLPGVIDSWLGRFKPRRAPSV